MNTKEIIIHLNSAHSAFWDTAILLPNLNVSINEKWSVAQNVEHITIVLTKLNNYFKLPKSVVKDNFGFSKRVSVNNELFINKYQNELAFGAKATTPYIPETNNNKSIENLISEGKVALDALNINLKSWSEEELEMYNCPHPILGKIPAREVLYFTIYHAQHHHETIKKMG